MTKERKSKMREIITIEIGEGENKIKRQYYTVLGLAKRLPGKKGETTSPNTIYGYLAEANPIPSFPHAGMHLFAVDKLPAILDWLEGRETPKQLKMRKRNAKLYAN